MGWLQGILGGARSQTREQQLYDAMVQLANQKVDLVTHIIRSDDALYEQLFPLVPGIDPEERKMELITLELFVIVRACLASWSGTPDGVTAAQAVLDMIHTKCFEVISPAGLFSSDFSAFQRRTADRYREYSLLLESRESEQPPDPLYWFARAVCDHLGYGRDAAHILGCYKRLGGGLIIAKKLFDDLKHWLSTGEMLPSR